MTVRMMTLPMEMVSIEIASHMDSHGLACLAATCNDFKFLAHRAKRLAFREEVIRCAAILREIYGAVDSQIYLLLDPDLHNPCMLRTVCFLFDRKIDSSYRFLDPEIYDDMVMYGCPPDIPLIWNFFKKMCDLGLG